MRIGIDGRALAPQMTGTGRYVSELMRGLDIELPDAEFVVYLRNTPPIAAPSSRWTFREDDSLLRSLPGPAWSRFALPRLARRDALDVFWAAAAIAPHGLASPIVTTIFDLNHDVFPSSMPIATRIGHRLWFAASLRAAKRRVAISKGTAARVSATYGIACTAVVRPGIGEAFLHGVPEHDPSTPPYVLSVATREPRKNLRSLLLAMDALNAELADPMELWLVGSAGWGNAFTAHERHLLDAPWCRKLGYAEDAALPALYANARVFAFPSIYEGYGIPVAEALACGTPVVTTDIPELREAGGPDTIYTGTLPGDVLSGLREALSRQRTPSQISSGRMKWEDSARIMAAELRAAVD